MNRRGFLTSCLALAAAPAICRADSLMKIVTPQSQILLPFEYLVHGLQTECVGPGAYVSSVRIYNRALSNWELHQIVSEATGQEHPTIRLDSNGFSLEKGGRELSRSVTPMSVFATPESPATISSKTGGYATLGPDGFGAFGAGVTLPRPSRGVVQGRYPLTHNLEFVDERPSFAEWSKSRRPGK